MTRSQYPMAVDSDFNSTANSYLILGTLSSSNGTVFHYSAVSSRMETLARKGIDADSESSFDLSKEDFHNLLLAPHIVDINGGSELLGSFLASQCGLFESIHASYLSPLRVGDELVGLLTIGDRFSGGPYSEEELQILAMMSQKLSVALYNHKLFGRLQKQVNKNKILYEDLRQIYKDTIQAFAKAIDAKDDYTRGHSARVSQYAVAIGEEFGFNKDELEGLRFAGFLHDIGKITVDSAIIRKDTPLNEHEILEMHRHPEVGHEILSDIKFPWGDLSVLLRHHHEKVDGKGYPDGLHGEELHLGTRIITLADAFDAMTSDRPYRKKISLEDTLSEIDRCKGSHFDPDVVCSLFRVLEKELSGEASSPKILSCLQLDHDHDSILKILQKFQQPFLNPRKTRSVWGRSPSVYDVRQ
jgi:hypothetical protein